MAQMNTKDLGIMLGEPLFSGLTLDLRGGDRIGLVAANGRGKTTLLRCLAGQLDPTTGDITRSRGIRTGLVEQDVPGPCRADGAAGGIGGAAPRTGGK